ncbi:MAG TPA: hypothetical protein PLA97_14910, partial [Rubrivivax sp.]|nr:hypothetical protein [Rubrivivax sp.]
MSRLWSGEPAAPAKGTTVQAPAPPPSGADTLPAKAFGVRRPLIGANGALAGFELRLPPLLEQRLATMPQEAAEAAAVAHHIALLGTA